MRRVLIIIVISAFIVAGVSCSGINTNSANSSNTIAESQLLDMTDPNTALSEGNRFLDENQTDLAIQAYQQAIKLNPDLALAHFQLGVAYALLEMQYELNGTVDPDNPDARNKLRSQKEFEKAVETYKKWLTANPNDDAGHYNLARTYSKLGNDEEAEKEFKEAVKLKPEETEYQTELGNILIKLAQYREAIVSLKKAVEIDPLNERAASLLDDAEAGRQRLDYAISKAKDANQADQADPNAATTSSSGYTSRPRSSSNANVSSNSASNSATKPPEVTNKKPQKPEIKETKPEVKPTKTEIKGKKG